MSAKLNPGKALIFRITHIDNVPWILKNGLHCRNSPRHDPNFVNIGNEDLISKRHLRRVPLKPGGTLSDYVPFYFTPYSIMLYNIHTGYGGVKHRRNEEIVIFVTSLHRLAADGVPFLFTDQHAYPVYAQFFDNLDELSKIDWKILAAKDFRNDPEDLGKKERYQAEALVHRHVPLSSLIGICCFNEPTKARLEREVADRGVNLDVKVTPTWYF